MINDPRLSYEAQLGYKPYLGADGYGFNASMGPPPASIWPRHGGLFFAGAILIVLLLVWLWLDSSSGAPRRASLKSHHTRRRERGRCAQHFAGPAPFCPTCGTAEYTLAPALAPYQPDVVVPVVQPDAYGEYRVAGFV